MFLDVNGCDSRRRIYVYIHGCVCVDDVGQGWCHTLVNGGRENFESASVNHVTPPGVRAVGSCLPRS